MTDVTEQIQIIDGEKEPDLIILNAEYLHAIYKKWITGNIWIYKEKIVYAGKALPEKMDGAEVFDATGLKIVPGYIEPHVHPFQLYSPWTFANYASRLGTTTFLSDNLMLFLLLESKTIFSMLDEMKKLPFSFYWWTRFDSQTIMQNEKDLFNKESIAKWLERSDVLMGGELTGWPRLLAGDKQLEESIVAAKKAHKKIEGHLPGASDKTLARMKLLGIDGDHEAMTVEEVENRLLHGYAVTLRYSSIRPDLPQLLRGIVERDLNVFDHLMMTTDGSTPSFHLDGVMDKCIRVALAEGVPTIDAYLMASYNVARYYDITDLHGIIATGRYATLNFLEDETNPVPIAVLSKGTWLKRSNEQVTPFPKIDTSNITPFFLEFDLTEDDFVIDHTVGIEMLNDVITKPYEVTIDTTMNALSKDHDENFLLLIDRHGKWRVNTILKGFAQKVEGFATSYSNTGDIIVVGKDKKAMLLAFNEIKRIGGGMVLIEDEKVVETLPLPIGGGLSEEPMEVLMEQQVKLQSALVERGYPFGDAVYTFLFLQSTHLPYIRITPIGIYDVMAKNILVSTTER